MALQRRKRPPPPSPKAPTVRVVLHGGHCPCQSPNRTKQRGPLDCAVLGPLAIQGHTPGAHHARAPRDAPQKGCAQQARSFLQRPFREGGWVVLGGVARGSQAPTFPGPSPPGVHSGAFGEENPAAPGLLHLLLRLLRAHGCSGSAGERARPLPSPRQPTAHFPPSFQRQEVALLVEGGARCHLCSGGQSSWPSGSRDSGRSLSQAVSELPRVTQLFPPHRPPSPGCLTSASPVSSPTS